MSTSPSDSSLGKEKDNCYMLILNHHGTLMFGLMDVCKFQIDHK